MKKGHKELSEEEISEIREYFDKEIWPKMKKDLKDVTKKEACFVCFVAGSEMMRYSQEEEIKNAKEELSKIGPMKFDEIVKRGKESLWEDKTKVNGVWIDDKTGKRVDEE